MHVSCRGIPQSVQMSFWCLCVHECNSNSPPGDIPEPELVKRKQCLIWISSSHFRISDKSKCSLTIDNFGFACCIVRVVVHCHTNSESCQISSDVIIPKTIVSSINYIAFCSSHCWVNLKLIDQSPCVQTRQTGRQVTSLNMLVPADDNALKDQVMPVEGAMRGMSIAQVKCEVPKCNRMTVRNRAKRPGSSFCFFGC